MAVVLRAVVMLVVLVGLPSAWVYYGPLPAGAQAIVSRVVEIARTALAGDTGAPQPDQGPEKWPAGRSAVADPSGLAQGARDEPARDEPARDEPARYEPPYEPARYSPGGGPAGEDVPKKSGLEEQLEPHLSVLRKLGASEYTLEDWGRDGQLVRFRCAVSMGDGDDFTRQFEVVAADSLVAVRQVVGEVSSWQNARGTGVLWK